MILIGNIFTLLGSLCSLISTRAKTYKSTLLIQSLDATFFALGNLFLGGYSGLIVNSTAVVRNVTCVFFNITKPIKILFVVLTVTLGIIFRDKAIYGLLPIIASTLYLITMISTKDVRKLKISLLINNILWLIYGIIIIDISGTCFKVISITSLIQAIIKNKGVDNNGKYNNTENATSSS